MPTLEQVRPTPDWAAALGVALTRPPGVPERRAGEDPWAVNDLVRPRRISDDLVWLRRAVDEPEQHGLFERQGTATVGMWESEAEAKERLRRLDARGVLDAAGFLLHE
jgi:hypothetical protein